MITDRRDQIKNWKRGMSHHMLDLLEGPRELQADQQTAKVSNLADNFGVGLCSARLHFVLACVE
jgi:hypothetical protein